MLAESPQKIRQETIRRYSREILKNRPDAAVLKSLVAKAAKESGYLPQTMFHGSRSEKPFHCFNTRYGSYFTNRREIAVNYAEVGTFFGVVNPIILEVYLKIENPQEFNGELLHEFEAFTQYRDPSSELELLGFDGQAHRFDDGELEIRINRPHQVKSADAITLDDTGKIIPLELRFDPYKSDFRY